MHQIIVHGGDFIEKSTGRIGFRGLKLKSRAHPFRGEWFALDQIADVEIVAQDSAARPGASLDRAIVGGLLLGPVGAVVGASTAKKRTQITFTLKFRDGRTLLATSELKQFTYLKAAALKARPNSSEAAPECPVTVGGFKIYQIVGLALASFIVVSFLGRAIVSLTH